TAQNSWEQLTLLPEGSPASRFPQPGSEKAKQMTVTSGRRCLEVLQKVGQPSSLLRTFLESSDWHSTKCLLTWKEKGIGITSTVKEGRKSHRLSFQLAVSMPRTEGTGFGLLLTPTSIQVLKSPEDYQKQKQGKDWKHNGTKYTNLLSQVVGLLPTPTAASDAKGGCTRPNPKRQNDTLAHPVHGMIGQN